MTPGMIHASLHSVFGLFYKSDHNLVVVLSSCKSLIMQIYLILFCGAAHVGKLHTYRFHCSNKGGRINLRDIILK